MADGRAVLEITKVGSADPGPHRLQHSEKQALHLSRTVELTLLAGMQVSQTESWREELTLPLSHMPCGMGEGEIPSSLHPLLPVSGKGAGHGGMRKKN